MGSRQQLPQSGARFGRPTSATANLQDSAEPVFLDLPSLAGDSSLDITVGAVYAGSKYEDLCVSKMFLVGRTQ